RIAHQSPAAQPLAPGKGAGCLFGCSGTLLLVLFFERGRSDGCDTHLYTLAQTGRRRVSSYPPLALLSASPAFLSCGQRSTLDRGAHSGARPGGRGGRLSASTIEWR